MQTVQHDVDERSALTSNNKFELMLFKLGKSGDGERSELYGINVFKLREIMAMPPITSIAESAPHVLGVVNVRGQIIPVIDLPSAVGCTPGNGVKILMITEFARTTQGFAVEEVDEIVRLRWDQVRPAEGPAAGGGTITSIAHINDEQGNPRLVQVLDVEQILRNVFPPKADEIPDQHGDRLPLKPGAMILAADDSSSARMLLSQGFESLGAPYVIKKTGQEAWQYLQEVSQEQARAGKSVHDQVALILTDLEMPEMDGFTLTRNIKNDPRFCDIPVIIHSSLSGSTNENHVRSADAYVAKFNMAELGAALRGVLHKGVRA